jgi:CheY-like chemotaxis protein
MNKNKVLFIDDEVQILNAIKRATMEEDYEIFIATNGEKALELVKENEFCVLVTDMRMPGMDGLTLLKKVKELSPNTIRMVLSGYNQIPQILSTINQVGISKFITKPWSSEEEFLPAIRESIEYYNLKKEGEELKKVLTNKNNMLQNILKASNDTIANIQKDILTTKNLYDAIQNISKAILLYSKPDQDISSQYDSFNAIANKIFHDYLNIQPTKTEDFGLNTILNALNLHFADTVIFSYMEADSTFKGNYKVVLLIITELCAEMTKDMLNKNLLFEIVEASQKKIIFLLNKSQNLSINFENKDLGKLIYLLNAINTVLGGSVTIENGCIRVMFVF